MKLHWLIFAVLSFSTALAHAQQIVDGPDGKKILLKQDGSWEYIDETRLITTPDGRQARIKDDNTWEYVDAPRTAAATSRNEEGVVTISMNTSRSQTHSNQSTAIEYAIGEVFIVEETSRAGISKATRRDSSVHFSVEISSPNDAALPVLDPRALAVKDSRGESYNIVEASLDTQNIGPGKGANLKVVTDDSPMRIFNAREIYLEVAVGALGNDEPLRLTQPMAFVDRLDGLP
ncbi:MAG: DUF3157 family protein [Pseudomonadales bacterium]